MKEKKLLVSSNITKENLIKLSNMIKELSENGFISSSNTIQYEEDDEEKVKHIISKHYQELF